MTENNSSRPVQKNRFSIVMNWLICVLFTAMLCTPLVLLALTGQDKTVLDGEKQHEAPPFAAAEFISSEFQSKFELWFSTKYPMRGDFVSAYRQLQFDTSNIGFDISMVFLNKGPLKVDPVETEAPAVTPGSTDTLESSTDEATETEVPVEPVSPYSDFNDLYIQMNKRKYEREQNLKENSGYKGTDQVIIGKSGCLYENGYINEYLGYSQKYRDCTDEYIAERVEKLSYIQNRLADMGIAFTFIITPSKASEYAEYIPEWYKAQNTEPENYVRPVTRLVEALKESDVNYIYCAELYDEIGLDETFPLTGIHWNKPAAYEATRALVESYMEQTGETKRSLIAKRIQAQKQPSGFGNGEQDIFGIVYSGLGNKNAIIDEYYYIPKIEEVNPESERIDVLIQGGSFCGDLKYYLQTYNITRRLNSFYYNGWQGSPNANPASNVKAWSAALKNMEYVIFETTEQYVCMLGTETPRWGAADKEPIKEGMWDVYESLYTYLKSLENE